MADIFIKNMEMPETCNKCFIDHRKCEAYQRQVERIANSKTEQIFDVFGEMRLKSCPLVSLPEHGRLGDLDEISNKLLGKGLTRFFVREKRYLTIGDARRIIENAPVIVEASNGTDN